METALLCSILQPSLILFYPDISAQVTFLLSNGNSMYLSVQQQIYGFKVISKTATLPFTVDKDKKFSVFWHPLFQRGRPDLLPAIKRRAATKKPKNTSTKPSNSSNKPSAGGLNSLTPQTNQFPFQTPLSRLKSRKSLQTPNPSLQIAARVRGVPA